MADSVKFIFKTLIKVPIYIFVAYFIFNIFAFFFIYFRMLGISYIVMQTAAENNYLPHSETTTLMDYLRDTAGIEMVEDVGIVIGTGTVETEFVGTVNNNGTDYQFIRIDGDAAINDEEQGRTDLAGQGALNKRQYGNSVTCGVYCEYKIIWPLDYRYTGDRDDVMNSDDGSYEYTDVDGYSGTGDTHDSYVAGFSKLPILIVYKVPGLKYYPDLAI